MLLGVSPLGADPHIAEKLGMLAIGTLSRPLDIFDLLFHLAPALALLLKYLGARKNRAGAA